MAQNLIVKKLDKCGRVSIPKGIRDALRIHPEDKVGITMSEDFIAIKKINEELLNVCVFCGRETDSTYMNTPVCSHCVEEMYITI